MSTATIVHARPDETIWIYWTLADGTVVQKERLTPPDNVRRRADALATVIPDPLGQHHPRLD